MTEAQPKSVARLTVYLVNKLWLLIATTIIFAALVFTLLRIFLPHINYLKDDIESWVEQNYQVDVEVENITAEWAANGPVFYLTEVSIKSQDGRSSLLLVESMSIQLDGLSTILSGQITTENIHIVGANFSFIVDRQLGVRIDSLEESKQTPQIQATSQIILSNLFNQKNLTLARSKITVETLAGKKFEYQIDNLDITNFNRIHQIQGLLLDEHQGELNLIAEIYGDPAGEKSETHFYLEGKNIQIGELPGFESFQSLQPQSSQLNWRLWSDWREGRWQTALGNLEIEQVEWNDPVSGNETVSQLPLTNIDRIAFDFSWNFETQSSGQLQFFNGVFKKSNVEEHQVPSISLLFSQQNSSDIRWDLLTRQLQVGPFLEYFGIVDRAKQQSSQPMTEAPLSLNFTTIGIRLERKADEWQSPQIVSSFDELEYSKSLGLPVLSDINGEFNYIQHKGSIKLVGENSDFDYEDLFRDTLTFNKINISANFQFDQNDHIDIAIDSAKFENQDLSLDTRSRFFYRDEQLNFQLLAELSKLDIGQKSRYLPSGIMSDSLVEYLDTSVKSGQIPLAMAVVRGPIKEFPFANPSGVFSIKALAENTRYQYLPDWPIVENLKADLFFEGNGMALYGLKGDSQSISLNAASAIVEDFGAPNPTLSLSIDADSYNNQGRKFLQSTPLNNLSDSLKVLDYSGKVGTKVLIRVGLSDSSNIQIDGTVKPDKKTSALTLAGFKFNQIEGDLKFNEQGVVASELKAKYRDHLVESHIRSGNGSDEASLIIDVSGVFPSSGIADIVSEQWKDVISGESLFTAKVEIGPVGRLESSSLQFKTDLKGIEFDLPGDLAKSAEEITPLEVNINLASVSDIQIDWNNTQSRWWWEERDGEYIHRGGMFLANSEMKLARQPTDKYQGDIYFTDVSIDEWQTVIEKVNREIDAIKTSQALEIEMSVFIKQIKNEYFDISDVNSLLKKNKDGIWKITSKSNAGDIELRILQNAPWELEAKDLKLVLKPAYLAILEQQSTDDTQRENQAETPFFLSDFSFSQANVKSWPKILFNCVRCQIHDIELGNVQLDFKSTDTIIKVSGSMNNGQKHELVFDANWTQLASDLTDQKIVNKDSVLLNNTTTIEYQLLSNDFGKLLKHWKYPLGIEESNGKILGRLSWNDEPWDFNSENLRGDASFSFGKGYLNEISDAKARFFSLFSLQSLTRRLQLDFSDVYKKGFFFNKLSGDISLREGVARSNNIFVDGSAAKVSLSGEVDLVNQTIEQRALVVPHLTSSLPVLIGWAVEPTTGILVYLLNKLLEPAIDVVTQIEYRIHGALLDVKVDEIKKTQSKVIYEIDEATSKSDLEVLENAPSIPPVLPESVTPVPFS